MTNLRARCFAITSEKNKCFIVLLLLISCTGALRAMQRREETQLLASSNQKGIFSRRRIQRLLDVKDIDVNCVDAAGNTPLIFAAAHARDHVVQMLLQRGAIPGHTNQVGKTALQILFEHKRRRKHGLPDIRPTVAESLLAAEHAPAAVDGYLLAEQLHQQNLKVAQMIASARTRICREHNAATARLLELAASGDLDAVKSLLPQAIASDALSRAIQQDNTSAATTLLDALTPQRIATARHLLMAMEQGSEKMVDLLLKNHAIEYLDEDFCSLLCNTLLAKAEYARDSVYRFIGMIQTLRPVPGFDKAIDFIISQALEKGFFFVAEPLLPGRNFPINKVYGLFHGRYSYSNYGDRTDLLLKYLSKAKNGQEIAKLLEQYKRKADTEHYEAWLRSSDTRAAHASELGGSLCPTAQYLQKRIQQLHYVLYEYEGPVENRTALAQELTANEEELSRYPS